MPIEPVLLFILVIQFRRILKKNELYPEWQRLLFFSLFGIGVLFVLDKALPIEDFTRWIWHALLLGTVYIVFTREEFSSFRNFMYAFLPMIIIGILKDLADLGPWEWSKSIAGFLGTAMPFAFIWMVAMLIIATKQKKALDKEKKSREQEEREKKMVEEKKAELEILVAERTAEITKQKEELQQAVIELQSAQTQLIHAEKMASLGELTAGIAHEIQNPLNFVKNFSEVNIELAHELQEELGKVNIEPKYQSSLKFLANNIIQNQEKINHHGKRADAIVKGMLQHSRTSSGIKEPTDLIALADEYLRLSYHGLRAKDKLFNARIITQMDEHLDKIDLVPQDLGRALLNFFNNAFYAVSEKKKLGLSGYEPSVSLIVNRTGNYAEIKIRDNGIGIPESIRDKIFQPFFTTKPTGMGTGLGLSLSYDIITKLHQGNIICHSREGEGTEFIIRLPYTE
jgi:two-component system, NtrC family, sensor kinase